MRDAIGGTFMIKIFIVFLVFYIVFMTIAVSYAKVFRIKNRVVDILEFYQYDGTVSDNGSIIANNVEPYLSDRAYNEDIDKNRYCNINTYFRNGLCVQEGSRNGSFKVTLYLVIKFPLFGYDFVIPISGETRSYN